jgi:hypothetical protein
MIPVDQTTFGDGSDGGSERGNCLAACVASLLEIPLEDVPNFCALGSGDGRWFKNLNDWLRPFGLAYAEFNYPDEGVPEWFFTVPFIQPGALWIAGGPSPRGDRDMEHCVIMRGPGRELLHDPNPRFGRCGLRRVDAFGIILPLNPVRAVIRCRYCDELVPENRLDNPVPLCLSCAPEI